MKKQCHLDAAHMRAPDLRRLDDCPIAVVMFYNMDEDPTGNLLAFFDYQASPVLVCIEPQRPRSLSDLCHPLFRRGAEQPQQTAGDPQSHY